MMWSSSESYYRDKRNRSGKGNGVPQGGNASQQDGAWQLQYEMRRQVGQQASQANPQGQGERTTTVTDYNEVEDKPSKKSAIPVDEVLYERAEETARQQEQQEREAAEVQEADTGDGDEEVTQRSFMDEMFESDDGDFDEEYVDMPSYDELLEENAKLNRQLASVIAQYEHLKSDWDNYRKRAQAEAERHKELASERVATQIIPVIDDLWRSIDHLKTMGEDIMPIANGNEAIANRIISALAKEGIEVISPLGEQFDVNRHQAIALEEVEGKPAGIVFHVYQDGYAIGDRVIRPASVGVTK